MGGSIQRPAPLMDTRSQGNSTRNREFRKARCGRLSTVALANLTGNRPLFMNQLERL